jgi:hypothetical protein
LAKPGFAPPRPARTAVPGYPGTGAGLNKSRDNRHQGRGARDGGRDTLRHGRRAVTTRGMVFLVSATTVVATVVVVTTGPTRTEETG